MKILYLDCQAGISGDMTVGALLDLGVPLEHLRGELARVPLPVNSYTLSVARTERQHVAALKFDVEVHNHHTHRDYAGIDAMIAGSGLSGRAKETARRIFRRLAEAEAKVHGVPVEEVHFHEVGAVDSIIDIAGTAICLEYLGIDQVYAAPLPIGGGFVETTHGRLPVPAPATAELMRELRVHGNCGPGERVTPTGAAIVAALACKTGSLPVLRLEKTGCGAGGKDFGDCPNVLRAFLGRMTEDGAGSDAVVVAETNIDDSTPEVLGYAMERLLEHGALDVFFTPVQMKKNRPGVKLSFLSTPEQFGRLAELVLEETSTIGLRYYRAERFVLERKVVEQLTEFGTVRFKQLSDGAGKVLRAVPEYEDCRRIALELGVPCREIMDHLQGRGASEK